jgi:hypothetical protein
MNFFFFNEGASPTAANCTTTVITMLFDHIHLHEQSNGLAIDFKQKFAPFPAVSRVSSDSPWIESWLILPPLTSGQHLPGHGFD